MNDDPESQRFYVDLKNLPTHFPTHKHTAEFWESLGRAIASFGFLEEILKRAIFAFTGTRPISDDEYEKLLNQWLKELETMVKDPLGPLIKSYKDAVGQNGNATNINLDFDDLIKRLGEVKDYRNVLCHGSWRTPDGQGRSIPFFINNKKEIFQTPIDVAFLQQVQKAVAELACEVISSVTQMGWQFPGSGGPDAPVNPVLPLPRSVWRYGNSPKAGLLISARGIKKIWKKIISYFQSSWNALS